MQMIMHFCRLLLKNMEYIFQDQEMEYVIKYIQKDLQYREKLLLGSDSHTPTSSALGMIAIGAGGMSVAMAMAGQPFP